MSDVTRILSAIDQGDPEAAEQLLPLVYEELRRLAAQKLSQEKPGQTLQATDLVHEAYLRLVDVDQARQWNGRGHFFGAAAEAMRRILVENARRKLAEKHGGGHHRRELVETELLADRDRVDLLVLSDAIDALISEDSTAGNLAKLRFFAGLSVDEAGAALGLAHTTAYRQWTYARAWLQAKLEDAK